MAIDLLASGTIKTEQLATHVFPLDRVVEALETMQQGIGLKILVAS
jgi:threonine dehydrogenase-like Zn-dependent dehydrogenase